MHPLPGSNISFKNTHVLPRWLSKFSTTHPTDLPFFFKKAFTFIDKQQMKLIYSSNLDSIAQLPQNAGKNRFYGKFLFIILP